MQKTNKLLLIVCVVLVAGLSLTIGLLFGNHLNTPLVINKTNNTTNPKVNNSTTTQSTSNSTANQPSQSVTNPSGVQYRIEGSSAAGRPYCPVCGSNNVEMTGKQYTDANNITWYQVHCNYCGNTWYTRGPY